jgi:ribosome-binding protein aMBF1 (putative translation factor)
VIDQVLKHQRVYAQYANYRREMEYLFKRGKQHPSDKELLLLKRLYALLHDATSAELERSYAGVFDAAALHVADVGGDVRSAFAPAEELLNVTVTIKGTSQQQDDVSGPRFSSAKADLVDRAKKLASKSQHPKSVAKSVSDLLPQASDLDTYYDAYAVESAAAFVRTARQEAKLTQEQLAVKLGVNQSRVAELERGRGKQGPTIAVLARVAAACGKRLLLSLK